MSKLNWFQVNLRMVDGTPDDCDWEYEVDELRRAMEDAIASSQDVEREMYRAAFKPRVYLAIYPQDILQIPEEGLYSGVSYAIMQALHNSPKVSAAVKELVEERRVNQLTVWEAEIMPQALLDYKNSLRENRANVSQPAYRLLDQVDGKPLKSYSLSHLAFWNFLADRDVGKNDEAWLKKLRMKPFNETVPERDTHPLSESDRWLKSIGMKPFSETFREEKVAA